MAFRFWYKNNKISYDVCCLLVSPKCSVILKDDQDVCCLQNILKMFIKCNVTEILIVRSQMSATYKTFARTRSLLNVLLVLDHLLVDLVRSTEGTPQPYWNKLWNRWLCLAKCSHDHHVKNNSKTTSNHDDILDNVLDYGGPLMALLIFYEGRGPTIVATGALEFQRRSLLLQIVVPVLLLWWLEMNAYHERGDHMDGRRKRATRRPGCRMQASQKVSWTNERTSHLVCVLVIAPGQRDHPDGSNLPHLSAPPPSWCARGEPGTCWLQRPAARWWHPGCVHVLAAGLGPSRGRPMEGTCWREQWMKRSWHVMPQTS